MPALLASTDAPPFHASFVPVLVKVDSPISASVPTARMRTPVMAAGCWISRPFSFATTMLTFLSDAGIAAGPSTAGSPGSETAFRRRTTMKEPLAESLRITRSPTFAGTATAAPPLRESLPAAESYASS